MATPKCGCLDAEVEKLACSFSYSLVLMNVIDANAACKFLDALLVEGVPCNEISDFGE